MNRRQGNARSRQNGLHCVCNRLISTMKDRVRAVNDSEETISAISLANNLLDSFERSAFQSIIVSSQEIGGGA